MSDFRQIAKNTHMSCPSNSELIRDKIQLMNGPRAVASEQIWTHPKLRELMPWVVMQSYMVANASVPLMRVALQQCNGRADVDKVASGFAEYLSVHIEEETGHDEQCLEDLEVLGRSVDDIRSQLPWSSITTLVGLQYYWVFHQHPIAIAGYLATIEGSSARPELFDEVCAKTGLPIEGFRTLIWHARHDPQHSAELYDVLDELPLTSDQMSHIGVNIAQTNRLIASSVCEMIALFEEKESRRH